MSKKAKKRKAQAVAEARRLTSGKVLRLVGKTLLFALLITILFGIANALGVPGTDSALVQIGAMALFFVLFYRFIYSEFRPQNYMKHPPYKARADKVKKRGEWD
jgi:hypothetical protein